MFILAASVNASGTDVISPSFSLPIATSLHEDRVPNKQGNNSPKHTL
jgi:hypothetical protein